MKNHSHYSRPGGALLRLIQIFVLLALACIIVFAARQARGEDFTNLSATVYGTYAPQLVKPLGGGVAITYEAGEKWNVHLAGEVRLQYLDTSMPWVVSSSDTMFVPSGMVLLNYPLHWNKFYVTPIVEFGMAADMNCHPYAIFGGGVSAGYQFNKSLRAGFTFVVERWSGPYNSFTAYHGGLTAAIHWSF